MGEAFTALFSSVPALITVGVFILLILALMIFGGVQVKSKNVSFVHNGDSKKLGQEQMRGILLQQLEITTRYVDAFYSYVKDMFSDNPEFNKYIAWSIACEIKSILAKRFCYNHLIDEEKYIDSIWEEIWLTYRSNVRKQFETPEIEKLMKSELTRLIQSCIYIRERTLGKDN